MCNINPVPDIYSCIGGKMHWHLFTIKPSYLNCMSLVNSNQSQSKTNQLWPRFTWIEGLFQAKGVQDTEGEPDLLGLHLFAVEPVELHRLIDIVVVWHHRVGRDQWPSHAGGCWGHCTLRGRRRLEEEQHFGQGCAKWLCLHAQHIPVARENWQCSGLREWCKLRWSHSEFYPVACVKGTLHLLGKYTHFFHLPLA